MSNYVVLNAITAEQVEQRTEKLHVKVSNTRSQTVFQTTINSRHIIKWFEDEDHVYYYKIGGSLACIGVANNYTQYIELIVSFFAKKEQ